MTNRKSRRSVGRRPSVEECLEAWWRVTDTPAGKILPDQPHGKPGDAIRLCDSFDLYCWKLVGDAFVASKVRGIPATCLNRLVVHLLSGGRFATFRIDELVKPDPDDPHGFHSKAREVTNIDRLGVDDAWVARSAYARFRAVLQTVINASDPFINPARVTRVETSVR